MSSTPAPTASFGIRSTQASCWRCTHPPSITARFLRLIGAVAATISFVVKARLEERFLMQELGAEAYDGYRARVPMLVPFWPMGK